MSPKVHGYHNLKHAFAESPPRLWCNFSSGSGFLGWPGDCDYSPANEYLAAAARYADDGAEFTICWGLWAQTGMVRSIAEHLSRQFGASGLTNAQGAALFLAELAEPRPVEPLSAYGLVDALASASGSVQQALRGRTLLLAEPGRAAGEETVWLWHPTEGRDEYLREHLIDGRPTVPGVVMMELAAEAASALCPGTRVVGIRNIRLREIVYAEPGQTTQQVRVRARRTEPNIVAVRLTSDLVAPGGRVLRRDREHARLEVLLGVPPSPPRWTGRSDSHKQRLTDTLGRADVPVRLSGIWRTLHHLTADAEGAHAVWHPKIDDSEPVDTVTLPVLLLDALARMACYPPISPDTVGLYIPSGCDYVDLYTDTCDRDLAHRYPAGLDLWYSTTDRKAHAVTPDGEVLAHVSGVDLHHVASVPLHPPIHTDTPDSLS